MINYDRCFICNSALEIERRIILIIKTCLHSSHIYQVIESQSQPRILSERIIFEGGGIVYHFAASIIETLCDNKINYFDWWESPNTISRISNLIELQNFLLL